MIRPTVSATNVHAPLAVISLAISLAALSASSMPFAMEKITSRSVSFAPLRPLSGLRSDRRVNVTLDSRRHEDVARPSPNPAAELSSSSTGCSACRHRGGTHDSRHM
jgi:hypothetical protein